MMPDWPSLPNWRLDALCIGMPDEMFFPEGKGDHCADAIRVCRACPVAAQCLTDALLTERQSGQESWGVRGGLSAKARRNIIIRTRRAA